MKKKTKGVSIYRLRVTRFTHLLSVCVCVILVILIAVIPSI